MLANHPSQSGEILMPKCPFCTIDELRLTIKGTGFYVIEDAFPVTEGHSLVIPYRHVSDAFELSQQEWTEVHELLYRAKEVLRASDPSISGFNVGINVGETAGQTVMHAHIHLIPRREGDVSQPRGGIRHLMPGKGDY
jgi:diadenosine tetraphosphate (Ap4A) HIT family hydrolase